MRPLGIYAAAFAAIVAAVTIAARPCAADQLKVSIGNPNLEHFDTDGGVGLDFGLTDQNGNPVGNLRVDNVKVFEDGVQAKILDFRGVGQGRPVDIVFVMDVTESMQPYIDAIKQNVISFADDLAANNRDYRLGLVTFEDYVVSKYPDCKCDYRDKLTGNVDEFTKWIGSLHAGGGGDIPEDQLDALAYAATLPFRPNAQAIVILISDAPTHKRGDGPDREGDEAYREHHPDPNSDVTDETASDVAAAMKKNGITLYAVVPPPFIEPAYQDIVDATHGRSYNIITEETRFSELVREIGHSIATEYSLTYLTPRPVEDGTSRAVELKIDYNGQTGDATTSYQVRGIGGAAIRVPEGTGAGGGAEVGAGVSAISFGWWNGAVPLIALLGLFGLSRMRFGVTREELRAMLQAQQPAAQSSAYRVPRGAPGPSISPQQAAVSPGMTAPSVAGETHGARLVTIDRVDPVAAEYSLLKDEISIGRGETN
ncbi:MAG TPA: vWA domain-containing protein, partial [Candidatus Binataceae bacterium]|nr:vWA domain-containing protein [Candidatus Binataceae bacterium]